MCFATSMFEDSCPWFSLGSLECGIAFWLHLLHGWYYYTWKDCWRSWEVYIRISSTRLKQNVVQMSLQRNRHAFLEGGGGAGNSVSNKSRTCPDWFLCNYIRFVNTCEDSQTISLCLMSWLETIFQLHWFGAAASITSWTHMPVLDCYQIVPKKEKQIFEYSHPRSYIVWFCVNYTCDDGRHRLTRNFFYQ